MIVMILNSNCVAPLSLAPVRGSRCPFQNQSHARAGMNQKVFPSLSSLSNPWFCRVINLQEGIRGNSFPDFGMSKIIER